MANENQFLWKPESERDRNLAVLLPSNVPSNATVEIIDSDGNVIDTGQYYNRTNPNRATYRFSKPGSAYGDNVSVRVTSGGQSTDINIGSGGSRYESTNLDFGISGGGGGYSTDPGAYTTQTTEGDVPGYTPGVVDYGQLGTPQVDFGSIVGSAYGMGDVNRGIYYSNILSPEAQAAGLSAVGTDIAGIQMGANALAPMVTQAGRLDTAENIARAGAIDQFNLQRYPEFNRQAQEAKEQASQATGIDYQRRMNDLLDQLGTQARGEIPTTMAEDFAKYQAGRSADLAAASGISGISGAGVRLADRMNVMERLGMAERAQARIPGAATTAQQTLEAPTMYAQPTQVPLTQSNISQRLPVQANISAGATQLQAGTQATQLSTISPTALAQMGLSAEQWNQMNAFERDKFVLDRQQSQLAAIDQATMSQQYAALGREDYLDEREWSRWMQGLQASTGILSSFAGPQTTTTQTTGQTGQTGTTGTTGETGISGNAQEYAASTEYNLSESNVGEFDAGAQEQPASTTVSGEDADFRFTNTPSGTFDAGAQEQPATTETTYEDQSTPAGKSAASRTKLQQINDGGTTDTQQSLQAMMKSSKGNSGSNEVISTAIDGGEVAVAAYQNLPTMMDTISQWMASEGQQYYTINGVPISSQQISSYVSNLGTNLWNGVTGNQPNSEYRGQKVVGTDYTNKDNPTYTLENGEQVTNAQMQSYNQEQADKPSIFQQMNQGLSDYGLDWSTLGNTASTLANWSNLSPTQRAVSTGQIGTTILANKGVLSADQARVVNRNMGYLSTLLNPDATDIEKGSAIAGMGASALQFTDPNIYAGLQAISILGSRQSDENKIAALTGVGIDAAAANGIISQVTAGNLSAGLSVINTARNWDDMNDVQRAISIMSTGGQVMQAVNTYMASTATSTAGSSLAATGTQTAATGATATAGTGAAATGAGASAAGSTGGQTAGTAAGSTTTGSMANILSGAATYAGASYTAYNAWRTSKDTPRSQSGVSTIASMGAAGASVGAYHGGGYGALIGLGAGLQAGIAMEVHGTGKGKGQWLRDNWRDSMESQGLVSLDGNKHNVTLADGSTYDIGVDGGATLQNRDGTFRHSYDIDESNDAAKASIPSAHIAALATGLDPNRNGDQDLWHRGTAQLLNAASSNASTKEGIQNNLVSIMSNAGITPDQLVRRVETLRLENNIDDQEYGVYINSINEMYGSNYTPSSRQDALNAAIAEIEAIPEKDRPKEVQEFYNTITNDRKLRLNKRNTDKRTGKEQEDVWQVAGYNTRSEVPQGMSNWEMERLIERDAEIPTATQYAQTRESSPIMRWYDTEQEVRTL